MTIRPRRFLYAGRIRDVVKYAADLGITVIPEINLPGHMLAATAYPNWLHGRSVRGVGTLGRGRRRAVPRTGEDFRNSSKAY